MFHVSYDTDMPSDFDPNSLLKDCECIKSLTVMMHGDVGIKSQSALVVWGNANLVEDKLSQQISDMFKDVRFCSKCLLELRACKVGSYANLRQNLKRKTGCEVILYNNNVSIFGKEEQVRKSHKPNRRRRRGGKKR